MWFFSFFSSHILRSVFKDFRSSCDRQSMRLLLMALAVVIGSAFFVGISPIYMAKAIDAMSKGGSEAAEGVVAFAMGYLLLRFIGEALVDLRWIVINPVLYRISYAFCFLIAGRIAKIPRQEGRTGESSAWVAEKAAVISKMEMGSISFLYGLLAVIIPTAIELVIACIAIAIAIGPILVVYISLGGIVFMVGVSFKRDKELSAANIANQSDNVSTSYFSEYIANPALIHEFGARTFLEARLSKAIDDALSKHRQFFFVKTERSLYLTGITCVIYAAVLASAVFQIGLVSSTAGNFFLLVIYLDRILNPLSNASSAVNSMQNGLISIKGGYDLLADLERSAANRPFSVARADEWDEIIIDEAPAYFIDGRDLNIGRGSWVCIKGPSGAGKSTHLRKIYQNILSHGGIDGSKIHYLNPASAVVRGSVFENISLGAEAITREMVAAYWDFWNKEIGNRAVDIDADVSSLSAGETQFLSVCRTIFRAPEFVFFDEATNSMDRSSESKIWAIIREKLQGATVFVISHRDMHDVRFDFVDDLKRGQREDVGEDLLLA